MAKKKTDGGVAAATRLLDPVGWSGTQYRIRTLTLDELIAADGFPDDLLNIAVLERAGATVGEMARELRDGGPDGKHRVRDLSRQLVALTDRICEMAIVDPVLAAADIAELDGHDKQMIVALCQRRSFEDATGRRFGVATLDRFRGDDPEPAGGAAGEASERDRLAVPRVLR